MKNPVNDMPNHPYWDGKSRQQVYEIMDNFEEQLIQLDFEVWKIGRRILEWERRSMYRGPIYQDAYGMRLKPQIGRAFIGYSSEEDSRLGFRVVRNKS